MIELDSRLACIADLVQPGRTVADIGTDHGYLVAFLVASGKNPRGLACDINPLPLERASATVAREGLESRVKCLLSNGLEKVPAPEAEEIVLAGMGGDLIAAILSAAPWVREGEHHLVLQPMTKAEHLRRYLLQEGFSILEERAVVSGDFVYGVLSVIYTGEKHTPSLAECWLGALGREDSSQAAAYRERMARSLRQKVEGMEKATRPAPDLEEYRQLLADLEGMVR